MKRRKVLIEINLVEESAEAVKEEIEKEIFEELSKQYSAIPWLENVEKVALVDS